MNHTIFCLIEVA